jgi:23S rRNA pseudouridine1911/1915/1917 synthase
VSDVVFEVHPTEAGGRLDAVTAARTPLSRAAAGRLIDDGLVLVDDKTRSRAFRVAAGALVRVRLPDEATNAGLVADPSIDVPVRYEDAWLLVVSKPAGLVVHPGPGHAEGTLVNALLARAGRPEGGDDARPGIVHRLDSGTSGLMIVAKDATVHERLTAMMAARAVSRAYVALVAGVPSTSTGTIDAPIGRSPRDRKRMAVVDGGREAVTDFRLVEPMSGASLLEVMPRTGRTHQIRVHLAAIGHAVVGDAVYGRTHKLAARIGLQRPFLHALALRFEHPVTAELVEVEDPIPEDLEAALRALRDMAP